MFLKSTTNSKDENVLAEENSYYYSAYKYSRDYGREEADKYYCKEKKNLSNVSVGPRLLLQ